MDDLGKNLRKTKKNTEDALRRDHPLIPLMHRSRDIFDFVVPFEMEFDIPQNGSSASLSLYFSRDIATDCCGGCYCTTCEVYYSDDTWITSREFVPESVWVIQMSPLEAPYYGQEQVLIGGGEFPQFEIVNNTTVTSDSFGASANFPIKVCYAYKVCEY